jgi:hypothetical protein
MSSEEEGWIAEFEAAGEVRIRLYLGSGMHPEAKFHAAVRWLREQARARQTSRRRDWSLRLVDFVRCRSVGDRGPRRTDGDVVWTLSGPRRLNPQASVPLIPQILSPRQTAGQLAYPFFNYSHHSINRPRWAGSCETLRCDCQHQA